ncbi:MAG: hypothetical protein VX900_04940, partial [Pseudomonadota bacterium]|nr:hypothetical protein [Pseudomonadota bacterium]
MSSSLDISKATRSAAVEANCTPVRIKEKYVNWTIDGSNRLAIGYGDIRRKSYFRRRTSFRSEYENALSLYHETVAVHHTDFDSDFVHDFLVGARIYAARL